MSGLQGLPDKFRPLPLSDKAAYADAVAQLKGLFGADLLIASLRSLIPPEQQAQIDGYIAANNGSLPATIAYLEASAPFYVNAALHAAQKAAGKHAYQCRNPTCPERYCAFARGRLGASPEFRALTERLFAEAHAPAPPAQPQLIPVVSGQQQQPQTQSARQAASSFTQLPSVNSSSMGAGVSFQIAPPMGAVVVSTPAAPAPVISAPGSGFAGSLPAPSRLEQPPGSQVTRYIATENSTLKLNSRVFHGPTGVFINALAAAGVDTAAMHPAIALQGGVAAPGVLANSNLNAVLNELKAAQRASFAREEAGRTHATVTVGPQVAITELQKRMQAEAALIDLAAKQQRAAAQLMKQSQYSSLVQQGLQPPQWTQAEYAEYQSALQAYAGSHGEARKLADEHRALWEQCKVQFGGYVRDWHDAGVIGSSGAGLAYMLRMTSHAAGVKLWSDDVIGPHFDPTTGVEYAQVATSSSAAVVAAQGQQQAGGVTLQAVPDQSIGNWLNVVGASLPKAEQIVDLAKAGAAEARPDGSAGAGTADRLQLQLSYHPYGSERATQTGRASVVAFARDVMQMQTLHMLSGILATARARQYRTAAGLAALKSRAGATGNSAAADGSAVVAVAQPRTSVSDSAELDNDWPTPRAPVEVGESADPAVHATWLRIRRAWTTFFALQRKALQADAERIQKSRADRTVPPPAPAKIAWQQAPDALDTTAAGADGLNVDPGAAPVPLAAMYDRWIVKACHATCRKYYGDVLDKQVQEANKGEKAGVPYLPVSQASEAVNDTYVPRRVRAEVTSAMAIGPDGVISLSPELDAVATSAAAAATVGSSSSASLTSERIRITLADVTEYLQSQLDGRTPGAGSSLFSQLSELVLVEAPASSSAMASAVSSSSSSSSAFSSSAAATDVSMENSSATSAGAADADGAHLTTGGSATTTTAAEDADAADDKADTSSLVSVEPSGSAAPARAGRKRGRAKDDDNEGDDDVSASRTGSVRGDGDDDGGTDDSTDTDGVGDDDDEEDEPADEEECATSSRKGRRGGKRGGRGGKAKAAAGPRRSTRPAKKPKPDLDYTDADVTAEEDSGAGKTKGRRGRKTVSAAGASSSASGDVITPRVYPEPSVMELDSEEARQYALSRQLALSQLRARAEALRKSAPQLGSHPAMRSVLRWGLARASYIACVEAESKAQALRPAPALPAAIIGAAAAAMAAGTPSAAASAAGR